MVQFKPTLLFRNLRYAQAVCNSIADCGGVGWSRSARRYELRAGTTIKNHDMDQLPMSNIVGSHNEPLDRLPVSIRTDTMFT